MRIHIITVILNLGCVLSRCAVPQIHGGAATLNLSSHTTPSGYHNILCCQVTHSKSSAPWLDFPSAAPTDNFNLHIISLRMTFVSYTNRSIQLIICFWEQTTANPTERYKYTANKQLHFPEIAFQTTATDGSRTRQARGTVFIPNVFFLHECIQLFLEAM